MIESWSPLRASDFPAPEGTIGGKKEFDSACEIKDNEEYEIKVQVECNFAEVMTQGSIDGAGVRVEILKIK